VDPFWQTTIWSQFGASIDMLENAIRACPDVLWSDPSKNPEWKTHDVVGFWYVVFHTVFFLDFYMSESPEAFAPPAPFTLDELDPAGLLPDEPYTKQEMLKYLEYSRGKTRAEIESLTAESARADSSFRELGRAELLFYVMRHVQHHTGQLNLLLRQSIGSGPRWVKAATDR
jgi:hypothetical protein